MAVAAGSGRDTRLLLTRRERQVNEFQAQVGSPEPRRVNDPEDLGRRSEDQEASNCAELSDAADKLYSLEEKFKALFAHDRTDQRLIRAKLMIGELAELIEAMAERDEVKVLHEAADLEYVTVGTCLQFCLPLGPAFEEVHRSNMTKHTAGEAVANHTGDKGKGAGFKPAEVGVMLECARAGRVKPREIELTDHEVQSGLDRVRHAEGLIKQLPTNHEGRNTWLMHYAKDVH